MQSPVAEPQIAEAEADQAAAVKQLLTALSAAVAPGAPIAPRTPVAKPVARNKVVPAGSGVANDKIAEDAPLSTAINSPDAIQKLRLKAKETLVRAAREGGLLPGLLALNKDGDLVPAVNEAIPAHEVATAVVSDKVAIVQGLQEAANATAGTAPKVAAGLAAMAAGVAEAMPRVAGANPPPAVAVGLAEAAWRAADNGSNTAPGLISAAVAAAVQSSQVPAQRVGAEAALRAKPLIAEADIAALLSAESKMETSREQAVGAVAKANTNGTLDQMLRLKAKETLVQAARNGSLLPGLKALSKKPMEIPQK